MCLHREDTYSLTKKPIKMQLKCKGYHYLINGQNIWLEDKLDVNNFISKEEFELAITPDKNDNDYDKLVSKLAVHMGTRNKITGNFVDLYFFKNIVSAVIIIIFLASCSSGSKPKAPVNKGKEFVIVPMEEDNEGRPLFTMKRSGDTAAYEYMYAEEVVASMIRDTIVVDEMLHLCDNPLDEDDCWKNQVK
jgi:hypothetical protein